MAPRLASSNAIPTPIPREAPVTMATLPCKDRDGVVEGIGKVEDSGVGDWRDCLDVGRGPRGSSFSLDVASRGISKVAKA